MKKGELSSIQELYARNRVEARKCAESLKINFMCKIQGKISLLLANEIAHCWL